VSQDTLFLLFRCDIIECDMEDKILEKIEEQNKKIDSIYKSVEKTRKYLKWTFYITVIFFVLPLLAVVVVLPSLMSGITEMYNI